MTVFQCRELRIFLCFRVLYIAVNILCFDVIGEQDDNYISCHKIQFTLCLSLSEISENMRLSIKRRCLKSKEIDFRVNGNLNGQTNEKNTKSVIRLSGKVNTSCPIYDIRCEVPVPNDNLILINSWTRYTPLTQKYYGWYELDFIFTKQGFYYCFS
jgi:hypothetical protein